MKKRLLFMTHAMPIGGTEAALLAMLQKIDYEAYDVDLMLVAKEGDRLCDIPPEVRVMALSKKERIFLERLPYCFGELKKGHCVGWCLIRIGHSAVQKVGSLFGKQIDIWKLNRKYIRTLSGSYCVAVDYDGFCNPYILDKARAQKYFMWSHFNYRVFQKETAVNKKYFSRMDKIISVSENGADTLRAFFPELKDRIITFHNFLDGERILRLAGENVADLPGEGNMFRICSIGRLQELKDFGLSVRTARLLKDRGVPFVWYVVGEGPDRMDLERQIISYGLAHEFLLLGKRNNPYPYLKACDVYCQTSKSEGLCVAATEARFLKRPMVVTDVQGLRELVEDGETGYVVPRNEKAVADAIQSMDYDVRKRFSMNLENAAIRQGEGIEYFYQLINE